MKKLKSKITSNEFDKDFDNGKDMGDHLDIKKAKINKKIQRINIDFDFPLFFKKQIKRLSKSALPELLLSRCGWQNAWTDQS